MTPMAVTKFKDVPIQGRQYTKVMKLVGEALKKNGKVVMDVRQSSKLKEYVMSVTINTDKPDA